MFHNTSWSTPSLSLCGSGADGAGLEAETSRLVSLLSAVDPWLGSLAFPLEVFFQWEAAQGVLLALSVYSHPGQQDDGVARESNRTSSGHCPSSEKNSAWTSVGSSAVHYRGSPIPKSANYRHEFTWKHPEASSRPMFLSQVAFKTGSLGNPWNDKPREVLLFDVHIGTAQWWGILLVSAPMAKTPKKTTMNTFFQLAVCHARNTLMSTAGIGPRTPFPTNLLNRTWHHLF